MAFFQVTEPVYTCTCPRFTGVDYPSSARSPSSTTDLTPNNDAIPRTDKCKHIYAVMRLKGDPRARAPKTAPTMPLNHPHGNINPHSLSTYSEGYSAALSKDKRNKLWADSQMRQKRKGQKKEHGTYLP